MRIRLVRLACFSVSLVLSFPSAHADDDSESFYRGRTVSLLISSGEGGATILLRGSLPIICLVTLQADLRFYPSICRARLV